MRGVRAARLRAFAFASAAFSLLSCEVFAQTPGASPLPPLFPGFSTEALSRDASSEDDFGALGAFDTAQSRVCIPATDGTAPSVAGVPDLGGETGEVLCTHPAVAETRKREPNARFPLVLYLHPTHGLVFEAWIAQNVAMLRLLASRGFVVCAPTMVGARGGEGTKAPIVGGLFPGAQHTAAVAERRVFPRLLAFAPHAAAQLVRLSALGSGSANDERDERDECAFPVALDRAVDPARIAFAGFSSGGALAVYAADAAERNWPGATRAVVALAPTVGDFAFAREQFERRTRTMRVPMMLVAGAEDGMGGLDGLVELGDAATRAPRVGVAVAGASHCHLYIPVGSECDLYDPSNDKGGVGALGRFATSAFLHAYFGFPGGFAAETTSRHTSATKASAAIDAAWGGAETLNRFGAGAWNARVLVEPLVELGLFHSARDKTSFSSRDVATASYAYDPTHDAWTATVLLRVAAKGKGCLTEARIVPAPEGFVPDAEHPRRASDSLRAFLNANPDAGEGDVGARRAMPAQPVGASVLVFPTPRDVGDGDDGEGDRGGIVGLVLEWRADAFDARGALRDAPRGPRRRLLGGTPRDLSDLPAGPTPGAASVGEEALRAEDVDGFFGFERHRDRDRERDGAATRPSTFLRPFAHHDVFVDGEVAWPFEDPVTETVVRAFGLASGEETDSTLPPRRTETVRVCALDACDGGTAAYLTLEVAPPRLADASAFFESDYAVGAFGARGTENEENEEEEERVVEPVPASFPEAGRAASPAASWADALAGKTGSFARRVSSRWDPFSG